MVIVLLNIFLVSQFSSPQEHDKTASLSFLVDIWYVPVTFKTTVWTELCLHRILILKL